MTYKAILADPPWRFEARSEKGEDRNASQHYPVMSTDDIRRLAVGSLGDEDSILFLWATWPMIEDAFEIIKAWGYKYKTVGFVWVKTNKQALGLFTGLGYWTRSNTEPCLLATKGSPKRKAKDVHQVILAPVSEHSKKPAEQYLRIERLVDGPYLELFARNKRPGWHVWGNQVQSDIEVGVK